MMAHRYIVKAAAWLEIIVGIIFIAAPDILCLLLFDAKPEGMGRPLARWVGVALLALGIACLPPRSADAQRTAVLGATSIIVGTSRPASPPAIPPSGSR